MKKNKIIYWITTGIFGAMMLFSGSQYFLNPEVTTGFAHFGFPDYFRVELGTAKLIGALVLLIPQFPTRVKEWAYAGFGIVLISASIAHYCNGDVIAKVISPMVFLGILIVSNIYLHKVKGV